MRIASNLMMLLVVLAVSQTANGQRPAEDRQPRAERQRQGRMASPLFQALDTDQDGQLSSEELAAATESLKQLDSNGDDAITTEELRESMRRKGKGDFAKNRQRGGDQGDRNNERGRRDRNRRGNWGERLKELDTDQDGTLSTEEIPERMQRLVERFDEDQDGALSAEELETLKQRFQSRSREQ